MCSNVKRKLPNKTIQTHNGIPSAINSKAKRNTELIIIAVATLSDIGKVIHCRVKMFL